MKTTSFATAATLLSAASAATVTLETTPCIDLSYQLEQLTIEMNLSGPVARDLNTVCGLRIVSASEGVDINSISCQAFRDVVGTQPGSAIFTYAEPAHIATNPVQEKAIWCTYPTSSDKARRQIDNGTVSESISVPIISTSSLGRSARSTFASSASTTVGSASASASASASTTTITTLASASSGLPSNSANLTTPSASRQPSPSQSQSSTSPSATPGAASSISVGMGVVAAALAAMFL